MIIRIIYRFIAYAVCLLAYGAGMAQTYRSGPYDFSLLQSRIQGWVDSGYYQGASIVIVRDDKEIYKRYFGDHDVATVVPVASAGKWLAAATIAALVDEGKLHWQDKVRKWLPAFTDIKGEATLLQLLSHTAGYPDYQPKGKHIDNYQSLETAVAHLLPLPADTLPGTLFKYGGLSMQVAGRMAELATGKDWETIFREKIALPLDMCHTYFTPVDTIQEGHSPMLGGGGRTTLEDYSRFLDMISHRGMFKGKRVLSEQVVAMMQADAIGKALVKPGELVANAREEDRSDIYGLGEWREEVNAAGEATLLSSPSWAGAYPWIDKTNHTYGFFLARISQAKNGFNSFYASPVIPLLVRDAIEAGQHPGVKSGYLKVAGGQLFYETTGKGEPLIFIHGHSFDLHEWDPQFFLFAEKYQVIRYDVRGYGKSSMPVEFSTARHADDLLALMNALHITRAHVVGLSMGGFITTDFLALHQDRLLSATLASGDLYNQYGPSVPWTADKIAAQREKINSYLSKGSFFSKKEWYQALTMHDGQSIATLRKPVWNMIYKWNAWQPTHIEPRYLLGYDAVELLKRQQVTVPVMILTGSRDARGKPRKIAELVPSAQTVIVPESGHVSNLENIAGFNEKLALFLQSIKKEKK